MSWLNAFLILVVADAAYVAQQAMRHGGADSDGRGRHWAGAGLATSLAERRVAVIAAALALGTLVVVGWLILHPEAI